MFLFEDAYKNCNDVRSYITKQNKNMEAPDNDYGDFIVADFNFDGKDDFAIKYDSGGNAGSIYVFYIQQDNMLFKKDIFLSNHVEFFPIDIDSKSKTVTTHAHADVYGYYESVFRFNTKTKKWKMSERTYVKS